MKKLIYTTKDLIIGDPQEITRFAVTAMAKSSFLFGSIIEVKTFDELVSRLAAKPQAVCVTDYTLLDITAERLLVTASRYSSARFILFSDELTCDFVRRMAFTSKAFSVVMKDSPLREIRSSLKTAAQGEQFLCSYARAIIDKGREASDSSPLTSTEREILREIALGLTTKQIAAKRFSSVYTVMTHRKNIFRKLRVNNAQEAVRYALRAGIADSAEYYI